MFKIKIITNFSSAHYLREYKGKCENLHGHNWKVEVFAEREKLDSLGMVMDFSYLKKITIAVLEELDHKCLNDLDYFSVKNVSIGKAHNPSSEEIARYIYIKLKNDIFIRGCTLDEVRVWETDTSCASYRE